MEGQSIPTESTNFALKMFHDFWEEHSIALVFSQLSQKTSSDLLYKFYMGVRNKKREY